MEKTYSPQVISDTPYPVGTDMATQVSSSQSQQVLAPTQTVDSDYPVRPIARELISDALNTKSKKILQEFALTQNGGMQIGEYQPGISGDIRITPSGIVARDQSGNTTIGIDGDTGDAVFLGTLKAGSVVADDGDIVMEKASNGNGRIMFYNNGIPAILIGDPS